MSYVGQWERAEHAVGNRYLVNYREKPPVSYPSENNKTSTLAFALNWAINKTRKFIRNYNYAMYFNLKKTMNKNNTSAND